MSVSVSACGGKEATPAHADARPGPAAGPAAKPATPCLSFAECTAACDKRVGEACRRLSDWYKLGWAIPASAERQGALLDEACELGDPLGCPAYQQPNLRADLVARRVQLLDAGCVAGRGELCGELAATLRLRAGEPKDPEVLRRAAAAEEKGCELGDPAACFRRADRDGKAAARLEAAERRACETGDAHWCAKIDKTRAGAMYVEECRKGYPPSCDDAVAFGPAELVKEMSERGRTLREPR